MGPVELVFGLLVVIFAAIGVVRGYARELGITTMLLLALFVIEFTDEKRWSSSPAGISQIRPRPRR